MPNLFLHCQAQLGSNEVNLNPDADMNRERFHNALALSLGYERIVKEKRITIDVDDSDDPWVTLMFQGNPEIVRFKASGEADFVESKVVPEMRNEIKSIIDVVHHAYSEACSCRF